MTLAQLPRLLYIGDVPVESSYHGSALLYRLLQTYPPDRLCVVEGDYRSLPERRLPQVVYKTLRFGYPRLLRSRFHKWYALWLSLRSAARVSMMRTLPHDFKPEAVLTVAHGYSWVTAAEFARRHRLPLHLIVHDDWPSMTRKKTPFARVYREAASRLCVSPFMVDEYQRRYGVYGQVLYPSRAQDAPTFTTPPERLREVGRKTVFAFAGTINTPQISRLLRMLAECLDAQNGELLIFGPLTTSQAAVYGLDRPNIRLCGMLSSGELIQRLRSEVDALVVPMSFLASDRATMEVSFPSKLTDYTAVGLPLLIIGPEYCSAVRWARANPAVAEVVVTDHAEALTTAVNRLAINPAYRISLATAALAAGEQYFSAMVAFEILHTALSANDK